MDSGPSVPLPTTLTLLEAPWAYLRKDIKHRAGLRPPEIDAQGNHGALCAPQAKRTRQLGREDLSQGLGGEAGREEALLLPQSPPGLAAAHRCPLGWKAQALSHRRFWGRQHRDPQQAG